MDNKENTIPIHISHALELIDAKAALDNKKRQDAARQSKCRAKKKKLGTKKILSLRSNPRQIHYDGIVSNKLVEIMHYNAADRVERIKNCF